MVARAWRLDLACATPRAIEYPRPTVRRRATELPEFFDAVRADERLDSAGEGEGSSLRTPRCRVLLRNACGSDTSSAPDRWFDQEGTGEGHDSHHRAGAQREVNQGMGDDKSYNNRCRANQRPIDLASSQGGALRQIFTDRAASQITNSPMRTSPSTPVSSHSSKTSLCARFT